MSDVDNTIMEIEQLKAQVNAWAEAAFKSCGAWEPQQLIEVIQDKDAEIDFFRVNLARAREQIQKLKLNHP